MDKYKELLEKICREDGLTACVLVTQKDIPDDMVQVGLVGCGDNGKNLQALVSYGIDLTRQAMEQKEAADGIDR